MVDEKHGQEPDSLVDSPEFKALKRKERKFVLEYLKDFNASRAARAAGYSEKSAHVQGCQLLKKPNIKATLANSQRQTEKILEKEVVLSRKARLELLTKIATANLKNVVDIGANGVSFKNEINDDDLLTVKSISYSVSSGKAGYSQSLSFAAHDRIKALELLGRMTGDLAGDDTANKPRDTDTLQGRIAGLIARKQKLGVG